MTRTMVDNVGDDIQIRRSLFINEYFFLCSPIIIVHLATSVIRQHLK